MTNFNLSEKREELRKHAQENELYSVLISLDEIEKQDKEFIKIIKQILKISSSERFRYDGWESDFLKDIDKLAGDKLK